MGHSDARRESSTTSAWREHDEDSSGKNGEKGTKKNAGGNTSPKKKRRKVNHACVYCRRSHMTCDLERPCARCIKRDIGHLCHDEPREPAKRSKSEVELAPAEKTVSPKQEDTTEADPFNAYEPEDTGLSIRPSRGSMSRIEASQIAHPKPLSPTQMQKQPLANNQFFDSGEWDFAPQNHNGALNQNLSQNQFSDMHNFHPHFFNTSEVTNEYNMLGDFLSTSLLDDGAMYSGDDAQALFNDPLLSTGSLSTYANPGVFGAMPSGAQSLLAPLSAVGDDISRPSSAFPVDSKARDKFYMTAADPAGNDTPEERMNKLLKAKYDAGMLKPFNYVKGYARLNTYMERNMRPVSRHKILRQLDAFRPKFREAMQSLTDIQLVLVEMWFERSLLEYDRVFASMAIPACCWRRTGEIFRGNKEMADLIHVPVEQLRDVRSFLHYYKRGSSADV